MIEDGDGEMGGWRGWGLLTKRDEAGFVTKKKRL